MMSRKNKLRMCFLFIVVAVIASGIFYYYYTGAMVDEWGQGTLIRENSLVPLGVYL